MHNSFHRAVRILLTKNCRWFFTINRVIQFILHLLQTRKLCQTISEYSYNSIDDKYYNILFTYIFFIIINLLYY